MQLLLLILLRSFAWPLVLSLAVPPSVVFGYRVDNTLEHIEKRIGVIRRGRLTYFDGLAHVLRDGVARGDQVALPRLHAPRLPLINIFVGVAARSRQRLR